MERLFVFHRWLSYFISHQGKPFSYLDLRGILTHFHLLIVCTYFNICAHSAASDSFMLLMCYKTPRTHICRPRISLVMFRGEGGCWPLLAPSERQSSPIPGFLSLSPVCFLHNTFCKYIHSRFCFITPLDCKTPCRRAPFETLHPQLWYNVQHQIDAQQMLRGCPFMKGLGQKCKTLYLQQN